jgi:hypothetical protein
MKHLLPLSLLLVLAVGCSKEDEPSGDALLGHWQADATRLVQYDAQGSVTHDGSVSQPTQLDVTATTMSFVYSNASPTGPYTYKDKYEYKRQGEAITVLTPPTQTISGTNIIYVRSLTPTSFTYEASELAVNGGKQTWFLNFHR